MTDQRKSINNGNISVLRQVYINKLRRPTYSYALFCQLAADSKR